MPPALTLTAQQQDACTWLVERLSAGVPCVALRGLAGTGKSTLIPVLRAALDAQHLPTTVAAPTHRAAMILRRKGLLDAETVHSVALAPYFTADYARAGAWLGAEFPCHWREDDAAHAPVGTLPWLVHTAIQPDLDRAQALYAQRHQYSARRLLESIGIAGRAYFDGFGARKNGGVLLLDEASMVGTALLQLCQEAFPQVCLIGDPGQLPPVKDTAALHNVEGFTLTEIHRQAADSPIVQLAYQARQGGVDWYASLQHLSADLGAGDILERASADPAAFLEAPLLVWRNVTRLDCTRAIRAALGYPPDRLAVGEPLVCRSTSPEDRADGFYNNGLYRVVALTATDPRHCTVEDALGETVEVRVHLEEIDGPACDPRAVPFRFGYALTVHTAQGGEWPTVYVSRPDLVRFAAFARQQNRETDLAQWTYTAITRAKTCLCFLTQHHFTAAVPERTIMPTETPALPEPDDIPEPVVPAEALESPATPAAVPPEIAAPLLPTSAREDAVLHAFCMRWQGFMSEYHTSLMKTMDETMLAMRRWVETTTQANEHQGYQFANALEALAKHAPPAPAPGYPYAVQVLAQSPQGYSVTLTVQKPDAGELVAALDALLPWLQSTGYLAPEYPAMT